MTAAEEVHADAITWVVSELAAQRAVQAWCDRRFVAGLALTENILTRHAPEQEGHWALCVCCSSERIINVDWPCPDAQAALNFIEGIR